MAPTLIHSGDPGSWLELGWRQANRPGTAAESLEPERLREISELLDSVWDTAREIDPGSERDLSRTTHERVFHAVLNRVPQLDEELAGALYATLPDVWAPYDDTLAVLRGLRDRGCPVTVVSNVGFDVRPTLARTGIANLISGVALSYEIGAVKPRPAVFKRALEVINVPARRALMIGDSFADDAAAAGLGIRTRILPRTHGGSHGLEAVLRLVG